MKKLTTATIRQRLTAFSLAALIFSAVPAARAYSLEVDAASAILMEAETGLVMYEKDADKPLPPASVTKVMTMLLTMEAVDSGKLALDEKIPISENAASMGGSQIFLKPGEDMTAEELLKAMVIASANDAAVALAEHIAGSEEAFVDKMNARAAELGMANSHFENTNGLDDDTTNHVLSARDIALMTRELLRHPKILEYSSTWMDTVRDGAFGLTNTNRLIRFYSGANGLKTGSTSKAKFCISATAKRGGMQLIAVIMASPTRDIRNEAAKKLLDYGFSNYAYIAVEPGSAGNVRVLGGVSGECPTVYDGFTAVLEKDKAGSGVPESEIVMPPELSAPVRAGDIVGRIDYRLNGELIGSRDIIASENVEKIGYMGLLVKLIKKFLLI